MFIVENDGTLTLPRDIGSKGFKFEPTVGTGANIDAMLDECAAPQGYSESTVLVGPWL